MACTWVISPPGAEGVLLTFSVFDLESGYDYVRLYDCNAGSTCGSLASLSGTEPMGRTYRSETGVMKVVFTTDGSVTRSGFSASWTTMYNNECTSNTNNCDANAACTDTVGSFTCACNAGFVDWSAGGIGTSCDEDQCIEGTHTCHENAVCTDTVGSFTCACVDGYESVDGGVICVVGIDECSTDEDNCDELATCTNTIGSFTCTCNSGWTSTDQGLTCLNEDECATETHNCDSDKAACLDTDGSFTCPCKTGYLGSWQEKIRYGPSGSMYNGNAAEWQEYLRGNEDDSYWQLDLPFEFCGVGS
eukprot:1319402-Rhodomonas_salina.1